MVDSNIFSKTDPVQIKTNTLHNHKPPDPGPLNADADVDWTQIEDILMKNSQFNDEDTRFQFKLCKEHHSQNSEFPILEEEVANIQAKKFE